LGGHIVIVQGPEIIAPLDLTFVLGVFSRPPQNITVEVSIHDLSWLNILLTHNAFSANKNIQINIDLALF
jgi:hypothetical protein